MLGPFNFEKIDSHNRTRQKVGVEHWRQLYIQCVRSGIIPPTFGSNSSELHSVSEEEGTGHKLNAIGKEALYSIVADNIQEE